MTKKVDDTKLFNKEKRQFQKCLMIMSDFVKKWQTKLSLDKCMWKKQPEFYL